MSRIAIDKLLQKYNSAPSQAGIEWAQTFWDDENKVTELIEQCRNEHMVKKGKGKGIVWAVLGACLSCTQREFRESLPSQRISYVRYAMLKSEEWLLKAPLTFEREDQGRLETCSYPHNWKPKPKTRKWGTLNATDLRKGDKTNYRKNWISY